MWVQPQNGEPVPVKVLIPIAHPIAHLIPKKTLKKTSVRVLPEWLCGDIEQKKSWILAHVQHFAMILQVI